MPETFMKFKNDQYGKGLTLQEYEGAFYLISSRETQDGKIYHEWGYPQRDRKPGEKAFPWKIKLGNTQQEAFETLAHFGRMLKAKS